MTVPEIVHQALEVKDRPYNLSAGEWLKQQCMASAMGAEIVLRLAPVVEGLQASLPLRPPVDSLQELPLGGGRVS